MFNRGGRGKPKGFGFGGFSLAGAKRPSDSSNMASSHAVPPPPSIMNQVSSSSGNMKRGYAAMTAISRNAMAATFGMPCDRAKTEEEYFEDEDDDGRIAGVRPTAVSSDGLEYIPAPGSPTLTKSKRVGSSSDSDSDDQRPKNEDDEEDDPLDAFMAVIEKEVKATVKDVKEVEGCKTNDSTDPNKGIRDDIDGEDDEESYYRYMEENPTAGLLPGDSDGEGDVEYDEDGNPIAPVRSKYIDPLPPMNHSEVEYTDFERNFYEEHSDIAALSNSEVEELKRKLGIKVTGADPKKPVTSFAHFGFDESLLKVIRKLEYTQPTPIQAQAVPIALSGRDIIGIAKTGSGKTAAFIWPMLVHIMDQNQLKPGDGPIGLILAPTRELSQQIYVEAKKFGKVYNIQVICCYGGGSKWEQSKALGEGAEIVVATPGRIIDLVKMKATNLRRVTFLVLDEADRMFDMGFEPQVRSICDHVRPTRQTLMFSATFKRRIEKLARDVLNDPIRVVQGDVGEANEDVTQVVKLFSSAPDKWSWLTSKLVEFTSTGSVLVFVTRKDNSEELTTNLKARDLPVGLLHGDMDQIDRNKIITSFKKAEFSVLVATDVAARGLDIPHIRTVINYDVARDVDTHTHRVGRTGRAGEKGVAYTLVTDKDKEFAGHLVRNLEGASQEVPRELMDLAMQSSWFRKSRFKGGKGKRLSAGGRGLGFRERPGLGSAVQSGVISSVSAGASTYEAASASSKAGPQTDRLSAMKASFQAQYKNQFTAASSEIPWKNSGSSQRFDSKALLPPPQPPSSSTADKSNRKRSRWDK